MKKLLPILFLACCLPAFAQFSVTTTSNGVLNAAGNVGRSTNFFKTNMNRLIAAAATETFSNVTIVTPTLKNGYWTNAIADRLTATNFSAPGTAAKTLQIGSNAVASALSAIALGNDSEATNTSAVAIGASAKARETSTTALGTSASATAPAAIAIGSGSAATEGSAIAIGVGSEAGYTNSVAIGRDAATTDTNQVRLGTSAHTVSIPGELRGLNESNVVTRGTNVINARIDFTPRSDTGLLDGYNTGTVLGSNTYVFLSGPTGAHTNTGFAAEQNGSFHIVQIDNPVNNFTILNNTTANGETAPNRILTGTGGLLNFTNNPVILFVVYDAAATKWRLINGMPFR